MGHSELPGMSEHNGPATNNDAEPVGIIEMGGGSMKLYFGCMIYLYLIT